MPALLPGTCLADSLLPVIMKKASAGGNVDDDLRRLVDEFFAARKTVDPFPQWKPDHRAGEEICVVPISIDGEVVGALELNAYPRERQPSFRILIKFLNGCVCRLDNRTDEGPHYNSLNRPTDMPAGPLYEGHFHTWPDNRRFASMRKLPDHLPNARELPARVRSFESALRWFCDECGIDLSGMEIPDLPPRDRLL